MLGYSNKKRDHNNNNNNDNVDHDNDRDDDISRITGTTEWNQQSGYYNSNRNSCLY